MHDLELLRHCFDLILVSLSSRWNSLGSLEGLRDNERDVLHTVDSLWDGDLSTASRGEVVESNAELLDGLYFRSEHQGALGGVAVEEGSHADGVSSDVDVFIIGHDEGEDPVERSTSLFQVPVVEFEGVNYSSAVTSSVLYFAFLDSGLFLQTQMVVDFSVANDTKSSGDDGLFAGSMAGFDDGESMEP